MSSPPPGISARSPATAATLGAELKPAADTAAAPKPCCVCKDEKAARDECMLFSTGPDPAQECAGMVERYRTCMRGFGFSVG